MKKLKKSTDSNDKSKTQLFELETKCSRVTIDSRVCNIDKFNQFYEIIDNAKEFKNIISNHCFNNLNLIASQKSLIYFLASSDFPKEEKYFHFYHFFLNKTCIHKYESSISSILS